MWLVSTKSSMYFGGSRPAGIVPVDQGRTSNRTRPRATRVIRTDRPRQTVGSHRSCVEPAFLRSLSATAATKDGAADPSNPEPIYYIGAISVGLNKVEEARTNLEKYLSMNPTNAQNVATAQGLLQALPPKK